MTLEREGQVTAALAAQQQRSSMNAAALAASQQQLEDSRAEVQLLRSQLEAAEKAMRKMQAASAHAIAHLQRQNDSSLLQLKQQRASAARAMQESQAAKFAAARITAKANSLQMQLQQARQHHDAEQQKAAAVVTDPAILHELLQGTQQPSMCVQRVSVSTCESQQQQLQLDACGTTPTSTQCQAQVAAADTTAAFLTEQQQQHSAAALAVSQQQVEDSSAEVQLLHAQIEAAEKAMRKLQASSAQAIARLEKQKDSSLLQLQQQHASAARAMLESQAAKFAAARVTAKANSLQMQLQQARQHDEQQKAAAVVTDPVLPNQLLQGTQQPSVGAQQESVAAIVSVKHQQQLLHTCSATPTSTQCQVQVAVADTTAAHEAEQQHHSITAEKLSDSQEQMRQMEAALMQLQRSAASTQLALLKLQRTSSTTITKLQQQVDTAQHLEQRQRKVVASLVRCAAEAAAARFSVARLTAEKCSLQAQLSAATIDRSSEQTAQQVVTGYQQSAAQVTTALCQAALQQAGVTVCLSHVQDQGEETDNDQSVAVHNNSTMGAHEGKPAVQRTQHAVESLTGTAASHQHSKQQVAASMRMALPCTPAATCDSEYFVAAAGTAVAPRVMGQECCSATSLCCGSTSTLCSHSSCMTTGRCSCTTRCAGACVLHNNSGSLCAHQRVSISPECGSSSPLSCSPEQLQQSRQWGSGRTLEIRCSTDDSLSCSQDLQDSSSNGDTEEEGDAAYYHHGTSTTMNGLGEAVGGESCTMQEKEEEEELEVFFDAWDDGMGPCAV